MLTHSIVDAALGRKRAKRDKLIVLAFVAGGTIVSVFVAKYYDGGKVVEFGTCWIFEQCVGGVKAFFTGKAE